MSPAAEREGNRLVGVRLSYDAAPAPVRAWAEDLLGAKLVGVQPRVGGMSPAVAATLRAANGATAFVKAVGRSVKPDTPDHFRHEIEVLTALPPAARFARESSSAAAAIGTARLTWRRTVGLRNVCTEVRLSGCQRCGFAKWNVSGLKHVI